MTRPLKLKKRYIVGFGNWLGTLSLSGRQSRMRSRMVGMLESALAEYEKDRKVMLEEMAEKDIEGKPLLVEEGGSKHYKIPDEKMDDFNTAMKELGEEDAELSGPESVAVFHAMKDVVVNFPGEIPGDIASAYNNWCDAIENYHSDEVEK